MYLLQGCAMFLQVLVYFPLPFPLPVLIVLYVVILLISKPPDCVYYILQTNSFPGFLMCPLLPAPCTIYCEWLNFPLKTLALQQHSSSDLLLTAVFDSHDWTLGDLCIQPSPINPELLPKVTLMNTGIILWCRIRRRKWGTSRLWISYRQLFFLFFFYECNV